VSRRSSRIASAWSSCCCSSRLTRTSSSMLRASCYVCHLQACCTCCCCCCAVWAWCLGLACPQLCRHACCCHECCVCALTPPPRLQAGLPPRALQLKDVLSQLRLLTPTTISTTQLRGRHGRHHSCCCCCLGCAAQ
jgi:hypothetical protein